MSSIILKEEQIELGNKLLKEYKLITDKEQKPNLANLVENFSREVNKNLHSLNEIEDFCKIFLNNTLLHQARFLSTSMTKKAVTSHVGVIEWEKIYIPQNTQGAFIESYCIERSKEAEFLIQKGAKLLVTNASYKYNDKGNIIWVLESDLISNNIDIE